NTASPSSLRRGRYPGPAVADAVGGKVALGDAGRRAAIAAEPSRLGPLASGRSHGRPFCTSAGRSRAANARPASHASGRAGPAARPPMAGSGGPPRWIIAVLVLEGEKADRRLLLFVIERHFIRHQRGRVIGLGDRETRGQVAVEQARAFEFGKA